MLNSRNLLWGKTPNFCVFEALSKFVSFLSLILRVWQPSLGVGNVTKGFSTKLHFIPISVKLIPPRFLLICYIIQDSENVYIYIYIYSIPMEMNPYTALYYRLSGFKCDVKLLRFSRFETNCG